MQSPSPVAPNLTQQPPFSYKDILVRKLACAVAFSVISQVIVVILYIIFANISIYPGEWLSSSINTFTQLSTWIFVTIFSFIIFAECLMCSKDYVMMRSYCSTRAQLYFHVFSVHNLISLLLHIVTGGAFVWQILAIVDSSNWRFTTACKVDRSCLVEDTFFLIVGGFWAGFYYFAKIYVRSKDLEFPVINQGKMWRVRTAIFSMFKDSAALSFWPSLYLAGIYYVWGHHVESKVMSVLTLEKEPKENSILIYFYSWWLSMLYFFTMNLIKFFFQFFLTAPLQFPLAKDNVYVLTLQNALNADNLPIIQHLACLDLSLLSHWSASRRQVLFALSQPGGHPHNWNLLVENLLKLFSDYTELLKKATENKPIQQTKVPASEIWSPIVPAQIPQPKYRNLRNMSFHSDCVDIVEVSRTLPSLGVDVKKSFSDTLGKVVAFLRMILGINFLFDELPQVNVQKCLRNGQLIIWTSQGIAELMVASLTEDKYGIVQKDLPVIVTSLVQLKQRLDKLGKIVVGMKRLEFNSRMHGAVSAGVKRSLLNISLHFGQYFNDFPLSRDVTQYLHANLMGKH